MIKVIVLLLICGLAFAQKDRCDQDTAKLCANIKKGFKAINRGTEEVGGADGPVQSTIINGNFTLLLNALNKKDKKPLNYAARKCLKDTVTQSTQIADYIDSIAPRLQNDKILDVQRNLRSVSKLYDELLDPSSTQSILLDRNKTCLNMFANFEKIDSGVTRIANGEDVNKVNAEVNSPQLASDIKNDYIRLSVVSQRFPQHNDIEECMANTSDRAEQQVIKIEGILHKLTDDRDKVNAVFKDFTEINELQIEHDRCPPKVQIFALRH